MSNKDKFKLINIVICEVENGYTVDFGWSFQNEIGNANTQDHMRDFVAKSEKEVIKIITEQLPTLKEKKRLTHNDIINAAFMKLGN